MGSQSSDWERRQTGAVAGSEWWGCLGTEQRGPQEAGEVFRKCGGSGGALGAQP